MNCPVFGLRFSSVVFGLMGLAHLVRVLAAYSVQIGAYHFGRRWSVAAVIVLAVLCAWLWMLASKAAKAKEEVPPAKPVA
jgi:4-hydroxybenzoate polyprenyltransferase